MGNNNSLGFLIGLGFGLGISLLFTPRSGRQTRTLIGQKAQEGTDYVKKQATLAREAAEELIDKSNAEVRRMKQAVEAGKQAYQNSAV